MIEGADGQYYLQAGAVLLAGTRIFLLFLSIAPSLDNAGWWRLEDKIGMPLDTIHTSGNIPHCMRSFPPSDALLGFLLSVPYMHLTHPLQTRKSSSRHLHASSGASRPTHP